MLLKYVPLSAIIRFFSCTPQCPGSYPWGYAYPQVGNHSATHKIPQLSFVYSATNSEPDEHITTRGVLILSSYTHTHTHTQI